MGGRRPASSRLPAVLHRKGIPDGHCASRKKNAGLSLKRWLVKRHWLYSKKINFDLTWTAIGASPKGWPGFHRLYGGKAVLAFWATPENHLQCVQALTKKRFRVCPKRNMQYLRVYRAPWRQTSCKCQRTSYRGWLGGRDPISCRYHVSRCGKDHSCDG